MTLVKKIKFKLFPILIKISMYLRWPALTAWALAVSATWINRSGDYTVLVLRRSIFINDVQAMARYSGRINYVVLERSYLKILFFHFLQPGEKYKVIETNYHTSQLGQVGKEKYYQYLKKVFPVLRRLLKFDAVFAGNIGYVEHQALYKICEQAGVPFVVLHKEGMAVKVRYAEYAGMYKNHYFGGAKLLFYNHQVRDALLDVGVRGVYEEQSAVVGIPRLDEYVYTPKKRKPHDKQILFLSFRPLDKFRYLEDQKKLFDRVGQRTDEFHQLVLQFAKAHPEFKVIIKSKMAQHYLDYAIRATGADRLPENVEMVNVGDTAKLIRESEAVLGFNSTGLIEALLAGKPIVTPYYGDIIADGRAWDYFGDYPELTNYARSLEDLEEYLIAHKFHQYDEQEKAEFLSEMIAITGGQASRLAEREIIETIKEYQHAS